MEYNSANFKRQGMLSGSTWMHRSQASLDIRVWLPIKYTSPLRNNPSTWLESSSKTASMSALA